MSDARTHDVVVVGGGLLGASLAHSLAVSGTDVALVDCGHPGRATDAGAGILSAETVGHPDPAFGNLALRSRDHYDRLAQQLRDQGFDDLGFDRCGLLSVALREGEDQWFDRLVDAAMARSPGVLVELDPSDVSELCPVVAPVRRVVHNPRAARVDGRRLRPAIVDAAVRHGATHVHAEVTGLEHRDTRVLGVHTVEGVIACGTVAICGGAWSPAMARQLDVTLPVHPLKGQIIHLNVFGDDADMDTGIWPIVQPVLGFYLVSWPGGRVACGGTMEANAGFDTRPTAAGVRDLLRECLITAPGLANATVAEVRVGIRPATPDDAPILGRLPGWDNAFVATGHGANGLLLGPYNAHLVAEEILGHPMPEWLAALAGAERFTAAA